MSAKPGAIQLEPHELHLDLPFGYSEHAEWLVVYRNVPKPRRIHLLGRCFERIRSWCQQQSTDNTRGKFHEQTRLHAVLFARYSDSGEQVTTAERMQSHSNVLLVDVDQRPGTPRLRR